MTTRSFEIEGMTCGACVGRVTDAIKGVAGVTGAAVTLVPPRAEVQVDAGVSDAALQAAVRKSGHYNMRPQTGENSTPAAESGIGTVDRAMDPVVDEKPSFYPLVLVVGFIAGVVAIALLAHGSWSWHSFMNYFMAGFFLVFSFFKLLDLRGFASTYRSYDIVAQWWKPWGYVYPFIELALGAAYLSGWQPVITNIVAIAVMLIGSIGVFRALLSRTAIRCACLGTAIKLPMTTVTLIEDVGMVLMAVVMLVQEASARA